jgi:hypothetical protein
MVSPNDLICTPYRTLTNFSLEHLKLSRTPFASIPPIPSDFIRLPSLKHLTLMYTHIKTWADIDNLESWTGGRLESLKISLEGHDDEAQVDPSGRSSLDMSGRALSDRPILISKLSGLTCLNSTIVSASLSFLYIERHNAECFRYHTQRGETLSSSTFPTSASFLQGTSPHRRTPSDGVTTKLYAPNTINRILL